MVCVHPHRPLSSLSLLLHGSYLLIADITTWAQQLPMNPEAMP